MAGDAEVKLYLDHVRVVIGHATERGMAAAAFYIEGQAKIKVTENDQVDTGFMRSSIYAVTRQGSSFSAAESDAASRAPRQMVSEEPLPSDAMAAVVAGANYSIYQEMQNSFLFAGAERAAATLGAEVERVFKEEVHD